MRDDARALEQRLLTNVPMASALSLRIDAFDGSSIALAAPLAPNVNDKQTGFAGSIASLAALSGWCLMTLVIDEAFGRSEVALYRGEVVYSKPVMTDFRAHTQLPGDSGFEALSEALRRKGMGRINLDIEVSDDSGVSATMAAQYAVRLP